MPCYSPLPAQKKLCGTIKVYPRKSNVVYSPDGFFVPCGQCTGCRLERSRQWAIRCVHEAQLYEHNQFITLTYDNEHLPPNKSLNKKHFQDFMKRLRKHFGQKIRYYHCGEYGEKYKRPHYHAIIFNLKLSDRIIHTHNNAMPIYTSEVLTKLWGHGYASTAEVTFDSAAYVARYVMKKITGKDAFEHYNEIDYSTGELLSERSPEYTTMSRRPGIGKDWYDKYKSDVYPSDQIVLNGIVMPPPRYYTNQYELEDPEQWELLKAKRKKNMKAKLHDSTDQRLAQRKKVKESKLKQLKRVIE